MSGNWSFILNLSYKIKVWCKLVSVALCNNFAQYSVWSIKQATVRRSSQRDESRCHVCGTYREKKYSHAGKT